jgi:transposase
MNYIGIDHHKQYSYMTVMDEDGNEVKSDRVFNTRVEVEDFLEGRGSEMRAVIEAGRTSYVMVDLLRDMGVDIRIAHPLQVKAIAKAKIKTDKRDSKILADLLRVGLIPEVYLRCEENRGAQRVLRHRAFYVGTRTRVKNKIRVLLAQQRIEIQEQAGPLKSLFSRKGLEALSRLSLPFSDKALLESLVVFYRDLEERIKESDGLVEQLYNELEEARLVRTIPGFGAFLSVLTVIEIADINRFESEGNLHSYAGVIPSTYSSGERAYHGRIIKGGNTWLRWAAVEAVLPATKKDFDIYCFYDKRARRKGANVAKVATARKLLTLVYRVLKDGREYQLYKR